MYVHSKPIDLKAYMLFLCNFTNCYLLLTFKVLL